MSTHLAHKLPWASLSEVALKRLHPRPPGELQGFRVTRDQFRAVQHFAKCFKAALREFAATDQTEEPELDPTTWPLERHSHAYWHWTDSLLGGYIALNLILAEPAHAQKLFELHYNMVAVLCGHYEGGHPRHMSERLRGAFGEDVRLKPLTSDVVQTLRDHVALLFKCMYKIRGDNFYLLETDVDLAETILYHAVRQFEVRES